MSIFQASVLGGIIIIAIIIIRSLLINRLRKSVIVFLWKLSLLSLSFPLSLRVIQMDKVSSRLTNPAMPRIETELDIAQAALHTSCQSSVQIPVLKLIWLAGAVVLASFFVISYIRCRQRFSAAESFTYGYLPEFLKRCALKRTVTVKVTDAVTSPMTYGIIRPVILLPKNLDIQNKEQLGYILLHEYCHIRRLDGLLKLWANAVLCLHWFNPLVWVMRSLLIRDIELRCDESVLEELGMDCRKSYAMMIIDLQEKKSGFSPIGSGFSKDAITERIEAIMKYRKHSVLSIVLAAVLIFAMTVSVYAMNNAAALNRQEREANALAKKAAEAQDYEVLEMDENGVCYVRTTPIFNGFSFEYKNFAFKGTVIFTDENGEPFDIVLSETDHLSITVDDSITANPREKVGFLANGEDVASAANPNSGATYQTWGLSHEFNKEVKIAPYISSDETVYIKSAIVTTGTAVYISAGKNDECYSDKTPLEEADRKVLDKTVTIEFSDELTKNLKAGDKVKIRIKFEHKDGEDLRWRVSSCLEGQYDFDGSLKPYDIKKGRLCDCDVEFEIPEDGNYVFDLTNYSTNPITIVSANIEIIE